MGNWKISAEQKGSGYDIFYYTVVCAGTAFIEELVALCLPVSRPPLWMIMAECSQTEKSLHRLAATEKLYR